MPGANFELFISEEALKQLRALLRVGNQRILFRLAGSQIQVYAVKDRKEAYE